MAASEDIVIRPQPGPQENAMACGADILIYGGAAGGGKTWTLLMEPLRHHENPDFGCTIFRRTYPQIINQGGMWDESWKLYPHVGAKPNEGDLIWTFPSGATVKFAQLQHEKNKHDYDGAQIALVEFDQLEHFTEGQFWWITLGRGRSMTGIQPYVRASCNPVPNDDRVGGWLTKLLDWWLDNGPEGTGLPIPERDGVVRWFIRGADEQLLWADKASDLMPLCSPGQTPLSFTFIGAKLEHNVLLERADPRYRSKLMALPKVERERLLWGNWKIKPEAGKVFDRAWFKIVVAAPATGMKWVRYWDKAGTQDGGKRTAGVLMGRHAQTGLYYVKDVKLGQWSFLQREDVIRQTAVLDGHEVSIYGEQEPGSSGKDVASFTVKNLAGWIVKMEPSTGDKFTRAGPFGSQAEAGNVLLVDGPWNDAYLTELHNAEPGAAFLDQMDASSGAFNKLAVLPIDAVPEGAGETDDGLADSDMRSMFSIPG